MLERFNTVTVGIPAQQFSVRCHVSVERQVPVMTEFAVRLIHIATRISVEGLRSYFGLSSREVMALIEVLRTEGLVDETEGILTLTSYASLRFVGVDDGVPRFTQIAERQSRPIFELLSFSPLPRVLSASDWDNTLDIDWGAAGGMLGRTIERAEEAFHRHFQELERLEKDNEQKRAFDVYKVDDITAGRRFNVPLPIQFDVDMEGNVEYSLEGLELLPDSLKSLVVKLTADSISRLTVHPDHFEDFINVFDDEVLGEYLRTRPKPNKQVVVVRDGQAIHSPVSENRFHFSSYVREVHAQGGGLTYGAGLSKAMLGALYLDGNRERLVEWLSAALRKFKSDGGPDVVYPTEMFWVIPDSELWGKTEQLRKTVERLSATVSKGWGEPVEIIAVCTVPQNEPMERVRRRAHLLLEAGFNDVVMGPALATSERFELLLLPGVQAAAMYQWKVPASDVVSVPIGFLTVDEGRLRKLLLFLRQTLRIKLHRASREVEESSAVRKLRIAPVSQQDFVYLDTFLSELA